MQVLPYAGYFCNLSGFLRSANATVGMTTFFIGCYKFKCTTYMAADCRRYIAWYHSTAQVVIPTWRAAGSRPYRRGTISIARVKYRPFPTVSLVGVRFNQRISKTATSVPNNCQLLTVNRSGSALPQTYTPRPRRFSGSTGRKRPPVFLSGV